jgi:Nuclear protein 96
LEVLALTSNANTSVQAGKRGTCTMDLEAQLQVWEDASMMPHIDPVRLRMYEVLGGELHTVLPSLKLPWRLAFGMHLW